MASFLSNHKLDPYITFNPNLEILTGSVLPDNLCKQTRWWIVYALVYNVNTVNHCQMVLCSYKDYNLLFFSPLPLLAVNLNCRCTFGKIFQFLEPNFLSFTSQHSWFILYILHSTQYVKWVTTSWIHSSNDRYIKQSLYFLDTQ